MPRTAWVIACAVVCLGSARAAPPPCPALATVLVFADNRSAQPGLTLAVDGELLDPAATCAAGGATTYHATLACAGTGVVRCGTVTGLRPGAWVNRLAVTVTGSDPQEVSQRAAFLANGAGGASNVLVWTVYPRTFVVPAATETGLRTTLAAASDYTAANPGAALVTFSRAAFPGKDAPQTIDLSRHICDPDGFPAGVCVTGSRVVVDGLDARGDRGGVILATAADASVVRIYGSDDVLRGLVLAGTRAPNLAVQRDAVVFVGAGARRNRLEQSLVTGPSVGDGVSIERDAGAPGEENVVEECEVTSAADKGMKVTTGGTALVRRSCIHDNTNGGVEITVGGQARAEANVIEHNVPGPAQNGLSVGGQEDTSTLETRGNVIRFAGGRGLSVVDNAEATFTDDYVSDNQFVGVRVETTAAATAARATFRGVAFVCNHDGGISSACQPSPDDTEPAFCQATAECCGLPGRCCRDDPACAAPQFCASPFPRGFGAVQSRCDGCASPAIDYGTADSPGRNAFTLNVNRSGDGVNFHQTTPDAVEAQGNQWEHCGDGGACDTSAVATADVQVEPGASVDLGMPPGARSAAPVLSAISPGRPRAGDVVRVYGENFDAVDAAACAGETAPATPCSAENPEVETANRQTNANRLRLTTLDGGPVATLYPQAVTPTMLVFRMPVDCFAPLVLQVSKRGQDGSRSAATLPLCDPDGCVGRPAGAPCDDGNACTAGDHCDGDPGHEACVASPVACDGPCLTCDPAVGCVPTSARAACDDGDACTVGDHCVGTSNVCVPGRPATCKGQCLTGACDHRLGCVPKPAGSVCDDGNPCTLGDRCSGTGDVCSAADTLPCRGQCLTGACDPARGCVPRPFPAPCDDGDACTEDDHCRGDADVCVPGSHADCDLGDPCMIDSCEPATGCHHDARSGFDAVACVCRRPTSPACASDRVPKSFARRLTRACALIQRAEGPAKPAATKRLLLASSRALERAAEAAALPRTQHHLSPGCAAALSAAFSDAGGRTDRLRKSL